MKLFIEMETSGRELDGYLLLAAEIFKQSTFEVEVSIGISDDLRVLALSASHGIYIFKSVGVNDKQFIESLIVRGYKTLLLPSEGITSEAKFDWYSAVFQYSIGYGIDRIFTWGKEQTKYINGLCPGVLLAESLGVPRFEALRKVKELDDKSYDVLFTTNFAAALPKMGSGQYRAFILKQNWSRKFTDHCFLEIEQKAKVLDYFIECIKRMLQEFPDKRIAIRTHPSEDVNYYRKLFVGTRLIFDNSSSSSLALQKALNVVHYDSTISIECMFLKIPCLCYFPVDVETKAPDPTLLSYRVHSVDALFDILFKNKKVKSELTTDDIRKRASELVENSFQAIDLTSFTDWLEINSFSGVNKSRNRFLIYVRLNIKFFLRYIYRYQMMRYKFQKFGKLSVSTTRKRMVDYGVENVWISRPTVGLIILNARRK